ncbi:MAG: DUF6055 domain-containing protein [Bacteroidota bacterium]
MKNIVPSLLLTLFFTFSLVQGGSAQDNIAGLADTILTSHVSTWETLYAIIDGTDPSSSYDKTGGAYGNWSGETNYNKWNWVEYDFSGNYALYRSDVYWWNDGAGIAIPYDSYLEYWDLAGRTWKTIDVLSGNGVQPDQYNITLFDTILTTKIRLNFISTRAQGILEWKVFGEEGIQTIPYTTVYEINPALGKGTTSTVLLAARNAEGLPLSGYSYVLNILLSSNRNETNESYSVNSQSFTTTSYNYVLPPTDAQGETSFGITIPGTVDPSDGIKISLKYSERPGSVVSWAWNEPGLTPPVLTADNTDNTVDHDLEITFSDNADWRDHLTYVSVNGSELATADYALSPGTLLLKPSNGHPALAKAGQKTIRVVSGGYSSCEVSQTLLAGTASASTSTIEMEGGELYRSSLNMGSAIARDRSGNPVQNYVFSYSAQITNTAGSDYRFKINGTEITSDVSGQALSPTNASGEAKLWVFVPDNVTLNDGIKIIIYAADGVTKADSVCYTRTETEKSAYLPNDMRNHTEFSWEKTAQTKNFIAFWGDGTGTDPLHPSGGGIAFNPYDILNNLETYFDFYVHGMNFIPNADSGNMGKYKFVVIVFNTWKNGYADNGAYGGSIDGVIGAMWMGPRTGFVVAHEFGHACQAMIPIQYPGKGIKNADDNNHIVGMFWEACANYMAYLSTGGNPNPIEFMNNAMMQYLTTNSMRHYDANYFPMYVVDNYGYDGFARLWRSADVGDHPFEAFGKGLGMTRDEMNDEACRYAMHNVTWDYSMKDPLRRIVKNAAYTDLPRVYTIPDSIPGVSNRLIVPKYMAPADYGYNIIPLYPNEGVTEFKIRFHGYENAPAQGAGWRYGVVSVDALGEPLYSAVFSEADTAGIFTVEPSAVAQYLVVIATPSVGHSYAWTPGWPKIYRYPYSLEFVDVRPAGHRAGYNSLKDEFPGAPHANGGGWVASTATVEAGVYVGPEAQVLGTASVSGNARIEDFAIVRDNARVSGNAVIRENAIIGTTAVVKEDAVVEKTARVFGGTISGSALVTGSAVLRNCTVSGDAVARDLAWLTNANLSGNVVVGGDVVDFSSCDQGVYLQIQRNTCDMASYHKQNIDVNPPIEEYSYYEGAVPAAPFNLLSGSVTTTTVELSWEDNNPDPVSEYVVVSGDKTMGITTELSAVIKNLTPGKAYTFRVYARSRTGSFSEASNELTVSTLETAVTGKMIPEEYELYPNPGSDCFTIKLPGTETTEVRVTDLTGKIVLKFTMSGEKQLSVSEIGGPGLYYISYRSPGFRFTDTLCIIE